jgi:hypothetical protein
MPCSFYPRILLPRTSAIFPFNIFSPFRSQHKHHTFKEVSLDPQTKLVFPCPPPHPNYCQSSCLWQGFV